MKSSIFLKIYTPVLCIVIVILFLFGILNLNQQKNSYLEIMKVQTESIAKANIKINTDHILSDDKASIISKSIEMLRNNDNIKYIIYDKSKSFKVFVSKDRFEVYDKLDNNLKKILVSQNKYKIMKTNLYDGEVFTYADEIRIANFKWGNVFIGISLEEYYKQIEKIYSYFLMITCISLILTSTVIYIFAKWITLPIIELKNSVNKVTNGELTKIKIDSINDEIDQLKFDFNIMIDYLENSKKQEKYIFHQTKMAQLGELVNNIAHQWRQPLSVITIGLSGIKLKRDLNLLTNEDFEETYSKIMKNAQYLSEIIDTFNKYSHTEFSIEHIKINDFLKDIEKLNSDLLIKNHIKLELNYLENDIDVTSSPSSLSHIITNLLLNSCNAFNKNNIHDRKIKISIDDEDANFIIRIEDNAGGIKDKLLENIFEPYFTTNNQLKGVGMGLYLSYDIVKNTLNGDIKPLNKKNGVEFILKFPKII